MKKDLKESAEFLSGLKKMDLLSPVLNIVFYYGEEDWDGSLDLHGLLGIDGKDCQMLKKYVPNYRINLIDPKKLENLECFQTDLQIIFDMLKYRKNKEDMKDYVLNHNSYFAQIDQDSYNAVRTMLGSAQHLKASITEKGGTITICKALDDLYQEGIGKGLEKGIKVLVKDYTEEGYSKETILTKLSKGFSLTPEDSMRYYNKFAPSTDPHSLQGNNKN